jgi:hypothetical protein
MSSHFDKILNLKWPWSVDAHRPLSASPMLFVTVLGGRWERLLCVVVFEHRPLLYFYFCPIETALLSLFPSSILGLYILGWVLVNVNGRLSNYRDRQAVRQADVDLELSITQRIKQGFTSHSSSAYPSIPPSLPTDPPFPATRNSRFWSGILLVIMKSFCPHLIGRHCHSLSPFLVHCGPPSTHPHYPLD